MSKLDELRSRKLEREKAQESEAERLEEEALILEEKYLADGMKADVDFKVVTTAVGNFVVKKPDFVTAKRFTSTETQTPEDVVQFVAPCVLFPASDVSRAVFIEHGGVAYRLAAAAINMYQADVGKKVGK